MTSQATNTTNTPSVFAISLVFGGGIGMVASQLLNYSGDAGFVIGSAVVFLFLSTTALVLRNLSQNKNAQQMWDDVERDSAYVERLVEHMARERNKELSPDKKRQVMKAVMATLNTAI